MASCGTYASYQSGCRCDACRAATAEYMRKYRKRTGYVETKARNLAIRRAADLMREHAPDLWREVLAEARAEYGLPTTVGPSGTFCKPIHIDGDRWVQFSPGEQCVRCGPPYGHCPHSEPPADWLDPTCETCRGEDAIPDPLLIDEVLPCPYCIDGLRRIAVTEPCENCDGVVCMACRMRDWWADGPEGHDCNNHTCSDCADGLVTVVHVVQDWGPVPVVDTTGNDDPRNCFGIDMTSEIALYDADGWVGDKPLPPDVDPQTLVGQWARGGRVVE